MERKNRESRKEFWDYIWGKLLSQDLSNHALCNIIFWFEPLRKKAWQELLTRMSCNLRKRDLRYLVNHCGYQPIRKEAKNILNSAKKPT